MVVEEDLGTPTMYKRKFSLPQRRLDFEALPQSSSDKSMGLETENKTKSQRSVDSRSRERTSLKNLNEMKKEIPKCSAVQTSLFIADDFNGCSIAKFPN